MLYSAIRAYANVAMLHPQDNCTVRNIMAVQLLKFFCHSGEVLPSVNDTCVLAECHGMFLLLD